MTAEMFDPRRYNELPVPDDITLDVAKGYMIHHETTGHLLDEIRDSPKYKELLAKAKGNLEVTVRFYRKGTDEDCPDTMTIGEFRQLPDGHIQISIGNGGVKSKPKAPELV